MNKKHTYNILNIVTVIFIVTLFFSCNDSFNQVQKIGISENEPIGIAEKFNLKYTDSGRLEADLVGAKMFDYTNRDFPFKEFTDGIVLYVFDEENRKSTIISDYAIVYDNTNLIDLQGHVVITTHDGNVLKTEQLYYDQKKAWVFTNVPVTFTTKQDIINGNGFDSNREFTNAEVLEVTGIISLDD
ncbi:LPS export ABC transporter periplasmic protein LptC [Flavivirga aquimarina]|uniref:LPS export ABC transporter periplasmic protein LptC n=1 Tax=Flavivirga aquimarina TaxID=2027862 RepID=A0ABT8WCT2_9FLAO|nr:LPS export ABC transporter periplasmic protein LptC [Flavivirga aquimarina]MDO5970826.1 LPS export ABC transporter periplasmic protein LptC [Flavivirga aquimarina]